MENKNPFQLIQGGKDRELIKVPDEALEDESRTFQEEIDRRQELRDWYVECAAYDKPELETVIEVKIRT